MLSFAMKKLYNLLLLSILGITIFACDTNNTINKEHLIPVVEAVQSQFGSLPLTERLTGVVKAKNQVAIYPQINAAMSRQKSQDEFQDRD